MRVYTYAYTHISMRNPPTHPHCSDAPTLFPTAAGMAAKDNKKDGKKPVDTSALAEKLDAELNTFLTEKLEKGNKTGYEYVLDQTPEELAAVSSLLVVVGLGILSSMTWYT